jgi:hypothetical protein
MLFYQLALFLHLVTLVVAASAAAVVKLAASRRGRARTIGEVRDWHQVLVSTSRLFPICLVAFLVTGGYMASFAQSAVWSSGFIVGGLAGVVLLFASGTFLGIKATGLGRMLDGMAAAHGADHPAPRLVPPALVAALPVINTTIALAVVFDMVLKPVSVAEALGVIAIGIVLGAAAAMRGRPAARVAPASVQMSH